MRGHGFVDEDVPRVALVAEADGDEMHLGAILGVLPDDFLGRVGAAVRHHVDLEAHFAVGGEDAVEARPDVAFLVMREDHYGSRFHGGFSAIARRRAGSRGWPCALETWRTGTPATGR